jgi:hypothetical protein
MTDRHVATSSPGVLYGPGRLRHTTEKRGRAARTVGLAARPGSVSEAVEVAAHHGRLNVVRPNGATLTGWRVWNEVNPVGERAEYDRSADQVGPAYRWLARF